MHVSLLATVCFLWINSSKWNCWLWYLYFVISCFLSCLPWWPDPVTFPPQCTWVAFLHVLSTLAICLFFFLTLHNCISFAKYQNETSHSNRCGVMSHCVLTCISPKISDIEHFKMYLLVICLSLEKFLFSSFKIRLFLLSHYKEWNNAICSNMDGAGDYIILTEVNQIELDKCHVILLKRGI